MSSWDIDAPSVGGVLNTVMGLLGDGSGDALDGSLTTAGNGIVTAASASCSGPVQSELYVFLENYGLLAEEMVNRAGSALEGCALAVDAYLTGDLEMAEEAQNSATAGEVDPLNVPV
ncbi:DUF6507 family protein [Nocardiopsis algeriensis]|uniref:Excreted virulence factor EspC (Type VII ESX diderm) n=1 Tax=Nocardiopsis algeriensis TaxID=1478215 RepID=A0A841IPZ9_9ACTN|nr:DUF6507 family protein [Nocardiopsis algeriensis]MBB6120270.1 hypothetical protein [Nocardiopsis algeriensis]